MKTVLVANRGEIAVRVIRACRALGLRTIAVYSEADREALHTRLADRAVCIGPAPAARSYLDVAALLATARGTGADALHPGYGFLAENADFAAACVEAGVTFVGPSAEAMRIMGDKVHARERAAALGVPIVPGSRAPIRDVVQAEAIGQSVGYPLLLKAAAGGGGRGMRIARSAGELGEAFRAGQAEAQAAFGDDRLYVERFLDRVRHVEIQILADRFGGAVQLGERDCSVQRRHQKLLEEAPSPAMTPALRAALGEAALAIARDVKYEGAGTVEFVLEGETGRFAFIEMNTRIQVEHPVTEMITGVDLVAAQLQLAAGERLPFRQADVTISGHAVECRINAEDPDAGFRPSPGRITRWIPPEGPGLRVDTHVEAGTTVPPFYDSLLAKVIAHGRDRKAAIQRMAQALDRVDVDGIATTLPFHRGILVHPDFVAGRIHTRWVEDELTR